MTDVLTLCASFPELQVRRGETLIRERERTDRLYVLVQGKLAVLKGGVRLTEISEPGAFVGEISAVLESTPTADVLVTEDSTLRVIENASATVRAQPELAIAIAQLLARRLSALTAYVVDIKRQYADSDTHLGVMDKVLSSLIAAHPGGEDTGSERSDVPDY